MDGGQLERVAPEEHPAQPAAPRVQVVHEHQLADDGAGGVRLADPGAALLVADDDHHCLGRAVEVARIELRTKNEHLDVGDPRPVGIRPHRRRAYFLAAVMRR